MEQEFIFIFENLPQETYVAFLEEEKEPRQEQQTPETLKLAMAKKQ